ncbi:hypothetical protein SISSUDRAFT_569906 [Sistotremastrum suecicum HHB10207 ss-3]|uniref:Uncharacterized protein n=1 Tax=Sistotremastrum suecicum HHB10207 ss-3 TaxID=1314776 RepID=A0A165XH41_9AGAM|nr:hypothetical protein SISSUDRAFT_569906 [Sistotremastrum suecicum HHB10207 ss-3]
MAGRTAFSATPLLTFLDASVLHDWIACHISLDNNRSRLLLPKCCHPPLTISVKLGYPCKRLSSSHRRLVSLQSSNRLAIHAIKITSITTRQRVAISYVSVAPLFSFLSLSI